MGLGLPTSDQGDELYAACLGGQAHVVRWSPLTTWSPVNTKSPLTAMVQALHAACLGGQAHVVKYLLENGASPNDTDDLGCTPLHWTTCNGCKAPSFQVSAQESK